MGFVEEGQMQGGLLRDSHMIFLGFGSSFNFAIVGANCPPVWRQFRMLEDDADQGEVRICVGLGGRHSDLEIVLYDVR